MPEIIFLTEKRPLIARAADWLAEQLVGTPLDLSDTAIVIPTSGAGRRLREALVLLASERGTGLLPPLFVTPLALIDRAVTAPVADRQQRLAAWTRALDANPSEASGLLPGFSQPLQLRDSLRIADSLLEVCSLLAEAGLTPRSDEIVQLLVHDEERWSLIRALHAAYREELARENLQDPDEERIVAIREGLRPEGVRRIVVGAVSDLNVLARRYLAALEDAGVKVTVLVDAVDCEDARFDSWGCPEEEYWTDALLAAPLRDIVVSADAYSEAETAAALCENSNAALCLADERLGPVIDGALARREMVSFDPRGEPLASSEVAVVSEAWLRFCQGGLVEDLRILVECPVFQRALCRDGEIMPSEMQREFDELKTGALIDYWSDAVTHFRKQEEMPARFVRVVDKLRREFPMKDPRRELAAFLKHLYAKTEGAPEERRAVRDYATVLQQGFHSPVSSSPEMDCELLRDAVAKAVIYGEHAVEAIELNGWLEAAWLAEEFLVLTGCVEGAMPGATSGHPFLPDSARKALGLATNASRLARDSYLFHNLVASRGAGGVKFLYARESTDGEPTKPTRLFFRCTESELVERVGSLFRDVPTLRATPPRQQGWKLDVVRQKPPTIMRVTGFGDYLACPMRFYFKHALRLEPFDAGTVEMDAREFGTIFHKVVEEFARDPVARDSGNEAVVAKCVIGHLDRLIFARHGRKPSLPVRVQQESLRARLRAFARLQSEERAAGWRIVEAEYRFLADDTMLLGGLPVTASLDRVEIHEKTGQRRILDYKTFGRDKTPEKTHLGMRGGDPLLPGEEIFWNGKARYWKNLQLPLYRALAQFRWPDEEPPIVGYFLLPERIEDSRIDEFVIDDGPAEAAVQCAGALAELVSRGLFWPPREVEFDDFESWFLGENPAHVLTPESIEFLQGEGRR